MVHRYGPIKGPSVSDVIRKDLLARLQVNHIMKIHQQTRSHNNYNTHNVQLQNVFIGKGFN